MCVNALVYVCVCVNALVYVCVSVVCVTVCVSVSVVCVFIGRHIVGRRKCRGNREKSHQGPVFASWARIEFLHLGS